MNILIFIVFESFCVICMCKDMLWISCRADVIVAIFWALVFSMLVISSYVSLYFRHFWLSFLIICLGIFLPLRLRSSRQVLTRKRERRWLLPLSMWICNGSKFFQACQRYPPPPFLFLTCIWVLWHILEQF